MSISIRVMDCAAGRPASAMAVRVERHVDGVWAEQARSRTDRQGRLEIDLAPPPSRGLYRVTLDTDAYFVTLGLVPMFPTIGVELRNFSAETPLRLLVVVTLYAYFVCQDG